MRSTQRGKSSGTSQRKCVGIEMCAAYKNKKQKKAPFEVSEFTLFFSSLPFGEKGGEEKSTVFPPIAIPKAEEACVERQGWSAGDLNGP